MSRGKEKNLYRAFSTTVNLYLFIFDTATSRIPRLYLTPHCSQSFNPNKIVLKYMAISPKLL